MSKKGMLRWGAVCAVVAGLAFIVPVLYVFIVLPAMGSSPTHAIHPEDFLPWMAAQGQARIILWWITAIPFLVAFFGVPVALAQKQLEDTPVIALVSAQAGMLGLLICALSSLALAAGEMPLAQAYATAQEQMLVDTQLAVIATYNWQRLVIALLFDFLGFSMIGIWIAGSSIAGLRAGSLPKATSWFGMAVALLCFCFAFGYITGLDWLGELGIGGLAFVAVPAWMVWIGIMLWVEVRQQP